MLLSERTEIGAMLDNRRGNIEKVIEDSETATRDEAREIKHDLNAEIVRTE